MPELPEVETVVRTLRPHLAGERIVRVEILAPRAAPPGTSEALAGRRVQDVHRHGKFIVIELDKGIAAVHLRMTGRLLVGSEAAHTRAVITTTGARVVFDDARQFGSIRWLSGIDAIPNVGPDALRVTQAAFIDRLAARRGAVKPALLDQSLISGLGNIYADEGLARARIHPLQGLSTMSRHTLKRLHASVTGLLEEAIAAGGSSISDYVDARGERGRFQDRHRVYGRAGEPCVKCGAAIRRIVVAQRGTHFCPRCQRLRQN